MEDAQEGIYPSEPFALLLAELDDYTKIPTGSGLDVPQWLVLLEEEVQIARWEDESAHVQGWLEKVPRVAIDRQELSDLLDEWERIMEAEE